MSEMAHEACGVRLLPREEHDFFKSPKSPTQTLL